MNRVPFALLLLVPMTASAKEYALTRLLNQVTAGQTFTVGADLLEPDSEDFSVGLVLSNDTADRALVVRKEELKCARGATTGQVKVSSGSLSLAPNETKSLNLTCITGSGATGPYSVEIARVYDDPEQFGQPTDAVLFERVKWEIAEAKIEKKAQKMPVGFVAAVTDHPVPPPAGPLGAPPPSRSALAALGGKVADALKGDGVKPPFEVAEKEYTLNRARNQVVVGEALTIGADAVHPQSDHYVVWLALSNNTDQGMVIARKEMSCWRGETQATLDHAAFGVGKDTVTLAAGETKVLTMACATGAFAKGAFAVKIARVFGDPSGSGVATGPVVLQNAGWSIDEAGLDPDIQAAPAQ